MFVLSIVLDAAMAALYTDVTTGLSLSFAVTTVYMHVPFSGLDLNHFPLQIMQ